MLARLVLDQWADITKVTEEQRAKVVPVMFRGQLDYKFPKGTEFSGDQALFMCRTGQAEPADDECMNALGWSESRRKSQQLEYRMNALGINDPGDRKLYRAGVIEGYDERTLKYIPGPNWDAYMQAKQDAKKSEDDLE